MTYIPVDQIILNITREEALYINTALNLMLISADRLEKADLIQHMINTINQSLGYINR